MRLHTAARRYCIRRHSHWEAKYSELQRGRENRMPYTYSQRDLATFPRYNVLNAILIEVQRLVPMGMNFEEVRKSLVAAGMSAESPLTRPPHEAISETAMDEERHAFCDYIRGLDNDVLWRIRPLPHRRVLTDEAAETVRAKLKETWGAEGCWYPLEPTGRADVRAFHSDVFATEGASKLLSTILKERGIGFLWQIEEDGTVVEIEVASLDIDQAGAEAFWSTPELDWIVYVSHESSVTVGGWMLNEIRKEWPTWERAIW